MFRELEREEKKLEMEIKKAAKLGNKQVPRKVFTSGNFSLRYFNTGLVGSRKILRNQTDSEPQHLCLQVLSGLRLNSFVTFKIFPSVLSGDSVQAATVLAKQLINIRKQKNRTYQATSRVRQTSVLKKSVFRIRIQGSSGSRG